MAAAEPPESDLDRPPAPTAPEGPLERADLGPRVLAAAGWTLFLLLSIDHVGRGPLRALDRPLFRLIPHEGPLVTVAEYATHLGDPITITAIALLGVALLLRAGDLVGAGILALARAIAAVTVYGMKGLFARNRPTLEGIPYECCAFPSGHATETAFILMLMAVLLFERSRHLRPWAEGVAIGLALVVGATRVMLGVHWPTDVVAGWGLGWGLAGAVLLLRASLERKKSLPHLAPGHDVTHTVGLCLPKGVHIHDEARVPVHVEDVAKRRPRPLVADPLHAQQLGVGVQGFIAREHARNSRVMGYKGYW